jgi:hypothetical protein
MSCTTFSVSIIKKTGIKEESSKTSPNCVSFISAKILIFSCLSLIFGFVKWVKRYVPLVEQELLLKYFSEKINNRRCQKWSKIANQQRQTCCQQTKREKMTYNNQSWTHKGN